MFKERLLKQKAFFNRRDQGDLLIYYRRSGAMDGVGFPPYFQAFILDALSRKPVEEICNDKVADELVCRFLKIYRESYNHFFQIDHDALPTIEGFYGIGSVTAAISGADVKIIGGTSWCEPTLDKWQDMENLKFDPRNVWIQLALSMYKTLVKYWEDDFLISPFFHRSPLDSAAGLRGPNALFLDLLDHAEEAKRLVDWCAEWSISFENFISENVGMPQVDRGAWGTYLPNRAVIVNGDFVDMINRKMQPVFDKPYNEKLFQALGGGLFHHHAIGLHQVDQIASTKNLLVQEIYDDPGVPSVAEVILNNQVIRDRILEASLRTPIMLDDFPLELLERLLPILKEGRFILRPRIIAQDTDTFEVIVQKIRKISNW